jgi:hypothetical protein
VLRELLVRHHKEPQVPKDLREDKVLKELKDLKVHKVGLVPQVLKERQALHQRVQQVMLGP